MLFLLSACGSKALSSPDQYEVGGEQVESLSAAVGTDQSGKLTELQTPDPSESASSSDSTSDSSTYTYDKLDSGGKTVEQYVGKLTAEDVGFQVVDENGTVTDPPDYTAETGSVILEKSASQDGKVLRMEISWTASGCEIKLTRPDGTVSKPAASPMTNDDAVQYLESLSPAVLGLSQSSMKDYRVYPREGIAMVDGSPCLKLEVYQIHPPERSNQIVGTYLLTGDKAHLYRLEGGRVEELKIS